jgi:superfamily I DNA/RNA helicase
MKPSIFQQNVFNFVTNETGNAVINAVAGSGKTTTLLKCIDLIPANMSVLMLAFNKSIVDELKNRIGQRRNVEVKTLHGLGLSAISAFDAVKVDGDKYTTHLNERFTRGFYAPLGKLTDEELKEYRSNIKKLVDLIRVSLVRSFDGALELAHKHEIYPLDNELQIVNAAIQWGRNNECGVIDFTDMVYLPNRKKYSVKKYDFVLIDECQDLNAAQRGLFLQCIKPETGRFIAVGDPQQAIYGFAGADVESFNILSTLPNTKILPLSICYRCAYGVLETIKHIVPQIQAADNAPEGVVNYDAKLDQIKDGDAVLCRVTAPLVELCMQYIGRNVKAFIKGRDIGANLIALIEKTGARLTAELDSKLYKDYLKLVEKIKKAKHCSQSEAEQTNEAVTLADKIYAISVLGSDLNYCTDLIARIQKIFSDTQKEGICLSTVHKSKGLEYDNVFILCPEKFYLPNAMQSDWSAEQESNLVYVAHTRAKKYLGFITDFKTV